MEARVPRTNGVARTVLRKGRGDRGVLFAKSVQVATPREALARSPPVAAPPRRLFRQSHRDDDAYRGKASGSPAALDALQKITQDEASVILWADAATAIRKIREEDGDAEGDQSRILRPENHRRGSPFGRRRPKPFNPPIGPQLV